MGTTATRRVEKRILAVGLGLFGASKRICFGVGLAVELGNGIDS